MAPDEMPRRILGRTGERVSAIGVGGWHLGFAKIDEQLAIRIVRTAIDRGINFMDNRVLGMKSLANGVILRSGTVSAIECLHYALHLPTSVVITGMESMENLEQALEAARTFEPMTQAQVDALLARTAGAASGGAFETFKTTSIFDATATHPEWLGEEPDRVKQVMQA